MLSRLPKMSFSRMTRLTTMKMKLNQNCQYQFKFQNRFIASIIVKDLLKQMKQLSVASIVEGEGVKTAAQRMEEKKIGALMVYNPRSEQKPVGIITARDIQHAVAKYAPNVLPNICVRDVMTKRDQLISVSDEDSLKDVAEMMVSQNIRHIPVLDEDGQTLGILSIKDVVREVLETMKEESQQLERIVTDSYSHN